MIDVIFVFRTSFKRDFGQEWWAAFNVPRRSTGAQKPLEKEPIYQNWQSKGVLTILYKTFGLKVASIQDLLTFV